MPESRQDTMLTLRQTLYARKRLSEALEGYQPQYMSLQDAPGNMVLGVVAEMGIEGAVVIVAGFANGDARLFLTTGGGIMGDLQEYPDVAVAAKALVAAAQPLAAGLPLDDLQPLPPTGRVHFALLTPAGAHMIDESQADVSQTTHAMHPLYRAMDELAAQLGRLDEHAGRSR